jgi:hypothetical protein
LTNLLALRAGFLLTAVFAAVWPDLRDEAVVLEEEITMNATRKLWIALALLLVASFGVLLWMGAEISDNAPPLPARVVSTDGKVLYTRADIEKGRQVWQKARG